MVEPMMPTAGPEVELNVRDWCASSPHEQRIYVALQDLTGPTPAMVRAALNGLGYLDERIHDLKKSGATTQFFRDLRENGGRLGLEGSVGGEEPVMDKVVAPRPARSRQGGRSADEPCTDPRSVICSSTGRPRHLHDPSGAVRSSCSG